MVLTRHFLLNRWDDCKIIQADSRGSRYRTMKTTWRLFESYRDNRRPTHDTIHLTSTRLAMSIAQLAQCEQQIAIALEAKHT